MMDETRDDRCRVCTYRYRSRARRRTSRSKYRAPRPTSRPRQRLPPLRLRLLPAARLLRPMPMMASDGLCCACNSPTAGGSSFAVAVAVVVGLRGRRRDDVRAGRRSSLPRAPPKSTARTSTASRWGAQRPRVFSTAGFTAGGMDTAGAGAAWCGGHGRRRSLPLRLAPETRRLSFAEGGGFAGGAAMGGAPARRSRDSFLLSLFPAGFGDASLGEGMPAMRRPGSSRDMVVGDALGGARRGLRDPASRMPDGRVSASASFAARVLRRGAVASGTSSDSGPGIGFCRARRRFCSPTRPCASEASALARKPFGSCDGHLRSRGGRLRGGGRAPLVAAPPPSQPYRRPCRPFRPSLPW